MQAGLAAVVRHLEEVGRAGEEEAHHALVPAQGGKVEGRVFLKKTGESKIDSTQSILYRTVRTHVQKKL